MYLFLKYQWLVKMILIMHFIIFCNVLVFIIKDVEKVKKREEKKQR